MTEFKLIYNLKGKTLDIYKKTFLDDGYEIISDEISNILLFKKGNDNLKEKQTELILKIAQSRNSLVKGILIVDITEAIQLLLENEEGIQSRGLFRWKLTNIINRAISKKSREQSL